MKLAGGAAAVLTKAQESFDEGDYRWVAEVANKVVFAEPENGAARELGARVLEQLGYQAENPTWRNEFLNGALELRQGAPKISVDATLTAPVSAIAAVVTGAQSLGEISAAAEVTIEGDRATVDTLFGLLTDFEKMFNIVEP